MTAPAKAAPMREDELRAIAVRDEAVRALEIIRADTDENVPNSARNDGSDSCLDGVHALASQALDFIGKLESLAHTARPDAGDEDVERVARALFDREMSPFVEIGTAVCDWEGCKTDYPEAYERHLAEAHAALAAMREGVDRGMVEREGQLAAAVAKILPIGNDRLPGDRVVPIYVRMDELRALHILRAALSPEQPR